MDDYIKRQDAIEIFMFGHEIWRDYEAANAIRELPAADVRPVKEDRTITMNVPQPGKHIQFCGQDWIALGIEQGGLLVIKAEPLLEKMPFDKDGVADWLKSSLRQYLNDEYLKSLGDIGNALLEFESDLTADDGTKDYGTCKDKVFLLSDALYRKYREYIPKYDTLWRWTITPYSPTFNHHERIVSASGTFSSIHADIKNSLTPSLCLNLSLLEGMNAK